MFDGPDDSLPEMSGIPAEVTTRQGADWNHGRFRCYAQDPYIRSSASSRDDARHCGAMTVGVPATIAGLSYLDSAVDRTG